VTSCGGKVVRVNLLQGESTTSLIIKCDERITEI